MTVHVTSKVRSVEDKMSSTNALDSRMQQGEGDRAAQPVHCGTFKLIFFLLSIIYNVCMELAVAIMLIQGQPQQKQNI